MSAEKSVLSEHQCRCDECAAERTEKNRRHQARRLAGRELIAGRLVHPMAVHGTTSAYTHWGCRCTECREAAMDAQRAKRAS